MGNRFYLAFALVIVVILLSACAQPADTQPATDPNAKQTEIEIDGSGADWADYPIVSSDPSGDQVDDSNDLGSVKVFTNDTYLYALIQFISKGRAEEVRIELTLADASVARLVFDPETFDLRLRNPTNTAPRDIRYQLFLGNDWLEFKVPLEEFGQELVSLDSVESKLNMLDRGDIVSGGEIVVTGEIDSSELVQGGNPPSAEESTGGTEFSLADYFSLPDNYSARLLYAPPAPDLTAITKSEDGTIFLQHGSINAGISTLNPETRETTRIYDLPIGQNTSYVVGGPGDAVFITIYGEGIFLVHADGESELWSDDRGIVMFYTPEGRAFGTDFGKTIVTEYYEGGGVANTIATGFTHVYDLVVNSEGTIYVSDFRTGDIVRIDTTGETSVLVDEMLPFDPMDISLGTGDRLFVSTAFHGLVEVDTEAGGYDVRFPQGSTCALRDGDFIFVEENVVMFTDPGAGLVTTLDLTNGNHDLVINNLGITRAAAIGPDDQVYFGARGCRGISNSQLIRLDQDGSMEVVLDDLVGEINQLVFAPDGGFYISLHEVGVSHHIIYYENFESTGVVVPGADGVGSVAVDPQTGHLFAVNYQDELIYEFSLEGLIRTFTYTPPEDTLGNSVAVSAYGQLFVQGYEADMFNVGPTVKTWIFSIDQQTGTTEEFFAFPRQGTLPFRVLNSDPNGNLWWIINPEFYIVRIEPDGTDQLFAQNLPIDSAAIAIDSNENVFLFSVGGIYAFTQD